MRNCLTSGVLLSTVNIQVLLDDACRGHCCNLSTADILSLGSISGASVDVVGIVVGTGIIVGF